MVLLGNPVSGKVIGASHKIVKNGKTSITKED